MRIIPPPPPPVPDPTGVGISVAAARVPAPKTQGYQKDFPVATLGVPYQLDNFQVPPGQRVLVKPIPGNVKNVLYGSSREALLTGGSAVIVGPADTTQQIALQGVVNLNRVWVLATGFQVGPPIVYDGLTVYIQP